jgi:hypothetical protein
MFLYLFRDQNRGDTFAYSTDVTGRNIPRAAPYAQWGFVAEENVDGIDGLEEVARQLRRQGFYIFRKPNAS